MSRRKARSLLDQIQLNHSTLMLVAGLEEFKGQWPGIAREIPAEKLAELGARATVESVGSSTRMDGARLADVQVESFLFGADPRPPATRDEKAVAGYADALEMVYDAVGPSPLSSEFLKQLHGVITWYSGTTGSRRGEYRVSDQRIRAFDAGGRPAGSLFEAAPPERVAPMIRDLVEWTTRVLETGEYHPLLVTASFVAQLHVIHPYREGSGRLCRLICTWMLIRSGYTYLPFVSLERILEESRARYHRALTLASGILTGDAAGMTDWTVFLLRSLNAQKDELKRRITRERRFENLPELSGRLLGIARIEGRLTMSGAVERTGANRNTIKVHLRKLVEQGRLVRHGGGRGTWYTPA